MQSNFIADTAASNAASTASLSASSDAVIFSLCKQVELVEGQLDVLYDQRQTIEDENRTNAELDRLLDLCSRASDELLFHLPPASMDGARAVARLAMITACRTNGGKPFIDDDLSKELAFSLVEWLVDGSLD